MNLPIIDGYALTQPWDNPGAGTSVWSFAKKDGKEYFIKQYISPSFPTANDLSAQLIEKKKNRCFAFYLEKKKLFEEIANCTDSNLIGMKEFLLWESKYYLVTEKVTDAKLSIEEIAGLPERQKMLLLLSLAKSLDSLHQRHIIHCDIKPSNVLLEVDANGNFIPKVIDFDGGFLEGHQPKRITFDQSYAAPEINLYDCGEDIRLTTKVDVFAAGLLFHQYMIGEAPTFEIEESFDDFGDNTESMQPKLSSKLSSEVKNLIWSMLIPDPGIRISMSQVVERLDTILNLPPMSRKLIFHMGKKKDDENITKAK